MKAFDNFEIKCLPNKSTNNFSPACGISVAKIVCTDGWPQWEYF